jgi:hypothetical protein
MRNSFILSLLLMSLCVTVFAGSIYDEYDNGEKFVRFDSLMNQVRFPTSDHAKMQKRVADLELAQKECPTYPQLPAALYFLGHYNLELKNYSVALDLLNKAKESQPDLVDKTPLDLYIKECHEKLDYRNSLLISTTILVGWSSLIFLLLILRVRRKEIKSFKPVVLGVAVGSVMILLLFSLSTASFSDGMADFYSPPTLVRSSLLSPGSFPLWLLAFCSIYTCVLTALTTVATKKRKLVYALLTSVIIGSSISALYYQLVCYDVSDRTGINLPKRITFKEGIIEWHKDIPDEMIPMYDKKLQLLIQDAKRAAEKEKMKK